MSGGRTACSNCIHEAVLWLNVYQPKCGISEKFSPKNEDEQCLPTECNGRDDALAQKARCMKWKGEERFSPT